MPKKTDGHTVRRAREASDKTESQQVANLDRVDPSLMEQVLKTTRAVEEASEALKAAEGAARFIANEVRERHGLTTNDVIDMGTGIIMRAKTKKGRA